MKRLTVTAHDALAQHVAAGDAVIDATAGNGFDTLFLAGLVGPSGQVFAFDIQGAAIDATSKRLADNGVAARVTLLQRCHSSLAGAIDPALHRRIAAVTFNLGYRPGGDKAVTSQPGTTLAAIDAALAVVAASGIVSVMAYRGHDGGDAETQQVARHIGNLSGLRFDVACAEASGDGPLLWLIRPRLRDRP